MNKLRLLHALIVIEVLSRPGRGKMFIVSALAEPMAFLAGVVLIFTVIERGVTFGDNLFVFLATGVIPLFTAIRVAMRVSGAQNGWRQNQKIPGVTAVDFILVLALLETLIFVLVAIILYFGAYFIQGEIDPPHNILQIFQAFLLLSFLGTGVGTCNLAISRFFPVWELLFFASQRGLVVLSGFFYIVDFVPILLRDIVVYNPIAHGVMLFKQGYYGNIYPTMTMDIEYLFWWALLSMFVGLLAERLTRRLVIKRLVRERGASLKEFTE